jgi:hypothetical protein
MNRDGILDYSWLTDGLEDQLQPRGFSQSCPDILQGLHSTPSTTAIHDQLHCQSALDVPSALDTHSYRSWSKFHDSPPEHRPSIAELRRMRADARCQFESKRLQLNQRASIDGKQMQYKRPTFSSGTAPSSKPGKLHSCSRVS